MTRAWATIAAPMLLAACGDRSGDLVSTPSLTPFASDSVYSLCISNLDGLDYVLGIQWQDAAGIFHQKQVAALHGSRRRTLLDVPVISKFPFGLILMDPQGGVQDAVALPAIETWEVVPYSLSIREGLFSRRSSGASSRDPGAD